MKRLPYRANTATGDVFDIDFALHPETGDSVRVEQTLSLVLVAIDRDLKVMGATSNGDILQALAMALAVRARMIHGGGEMVVQLTHKLVGDALHAAMAADRQSPPHGHA
ncbi:MAG: hypothetical protein VX606_01590 [Pseudomonadota bacterium]|nr:hypothetical protein [Pseudomonadota bacterium]